MSNGSEVLIYLSFLLKEAVIYLVAAATPNKHMVAMYQKLSFSDFILFYNSKNRHLKFLNLSPQGLISSIWNSRSNLIQANTSILNISFIPNFLSRCILRASAIAYDRVDNVFMVNPTNAENAFWLSNYFKLDLINM